MDMTSRISAISRFLVLSLAFQVGVTFTASVSAQGAEQEASMTPATEAPATLVQSLVQKANLLVEQGDKVGASAIHEQILLEQQKLPDEMASRLEALSEYSETEAVDAELFEDLSAEAQAALANDDVEGALGAQEAALLIATDAFGPHHLFSIRANRDLGDMFFRVGLDEEAESYINVALSASEDALGAEHPYTLQIHEQIATLYSTIGLTEEAAFLREMITATLESTLGSGHEEVMNSRLSKIIGLEAAGQFQELLPETDAMCKLVEQNYGLFHDRTLSCIQRLAGYQLEANSLVEAGSSYQELTRRSMASSVIIDQVTLNGLSQLAEVYHQQGNYHDSAALLSGVIQVSLEINDLASASLAKSYLGRVFNTQGKFSEAQLLTEEVLDYGLVHWAEVPENIYNTLLELGSILQASGKLADAEATYEEALQGLLQDYGELYPSTLVAMNNLGLIYEKAGFYDDAEPLLKETLEKYLATYGEGNTNSQSARNNLALLHESQGNFREAEPLYIQSLDVMTQLNGPDHTDTIAVKNNLAFLYMLMENFDQAAPLFFEVSEQWRAIFGSEHQNTLKATNNLGRVYHKMSRLLEAEQIISQTLKTRQEVLGKEHLDSIRSMIDLGRVYTDEVKHAEADALLTEALSLSEKILGNLHPYTFEALNALASVKEASSQLNAAVELRDEGFQRRSKFLDTMLWVTGENAREGYIRLHRPEFNDYISLLSKIDSPNSGQKIIDASIQRKGLLLKVTSEIQQIATLSNDPALKAIANNLEATRKELAAKTLSGPTAETKDNHVEVLYELEQQVNELQGQLGRASVRFRTSIAQTSAAALEGVLGESNALVDFLVYEDKGEPKLVAGIAVKEDGDVRYELVTFENRSAIEDIIIEYRSIIQDDGADEDEQLEIGLLAYELIWLPIQEALGDTEYVYLIPDGTLNILPFNALVTDDEEYLIQALDVHILSSARDLLPNEFRLADGQYVVLAGPDYDSEDVVSEEELIAAQGKRSSALQLGLRGAGTGLRGLNFAPLPGAEEEGRIIVDQVAQNDVERDVYFGRQAEEQVLANMTKPPRILHMATHGFFLEADDNLRKRLLKLQRGADLQVPPPGDNPLLRAGLAFAGINANAQFLGDIDTVNDGVLTALEVLSLNLSGTRLVVLSACETGLGEIHEGEGVYGLRRSFQEAGVAEVISSLWEVSDAGTQALMTDFYDRLLSGQPAREALRDAQLALIDSPEWGYPYVWSAFMIVGSYESAGFTVQ